MLVNNGHSSNSSYAYGTAGLGRQRVAAIMVPHWRCRRTLLFIVISSSSTRSIAQPGHSSATAFSTSSGGVMITASRND
jgi:hypothetical protein